MKTIGELAPTLFADRQARSGADAALGQRQERQGVSRRRWAASRSAGIFSVGVEEPYRWKDSVQSEAEIRLWVADGVANGLRPWFTKFAGTLHDRRWLGVVEELYRWHHRVRALPAQRGAAGPRRPGLLAADRLVLRRRRAPGEGRGPRAGLVPGADRGAHPVRDGARPAARRRRTSSRFKTLILPNIAALSDAQCRQLRAFVERGGGLVATYETSLYDEWGVRRKDFGLADLFGVSFAGQRRGADAERLPAPRGRPRTGSGIRSSRASRTRRASSTAPTGWTSTPTPRVPAPAADADPELSRPADGEGLPARARRPTSPRCTCARSAPGRVVYFPWDIDRIFWEVLAVDHGKLLRNAVRWATNEEPPVRGHRPRRARRDRLAAEATR